MHPLLLQLQHCWSMRRREAPPFSCQASKHYHTLLAGVSVVKYCLLRLDVDGPAACSMARSATTCVAFRRVAAADCVAHLALRTPFYAQNHDALRAWEHWSTGVVLFRSRGWSECRRKTRRRTGAPQGFPAEGIRKAARAASPSAFAHSHAAEPTLTLTSDPNRIHGLLQEAEEDGPHAASARDGQGLALSTKAEAGWLHDRCSSWCPWRCHRRRSGRNDCEGRHASHGGAA